MVTFHSVSSALIVETAGKERGFFCSLVPVPRVLSSSCGYAASVEAETSGGLLELLRCLRVEWEAVYRPAADGGHELVSRNVENA
jgi:hypothetical protein